MSKTALEFLCAGSHAGIAVFAVLLQRVTMLHRAPVPGDFLDAFRIADSLKSEWRVEQRSEMLWVAPDALLRWRVRQLALGIDDAAVYTATCSGNQGAPRRLRLHKQSSGAFLSPGTLAHPI